MCYRPSTTVTVVKCLECGTFNKPDNDTCQKCGVDLTASKEAANNAEKPAIKAPATTPGAQAAPGAPKAPGAPQAPSAPSAPSAPTAPKQ